MTEPRIRHNIIVVEDNYGLLNKSDYCKVDSYTEDDEDFIIMPSVSRKLDKHKLLI